MTTVESTESVYDVTSQNLHSVHASYNKNKLKMAAKEWTDDKFFNSEMIFFGLGWEENTSYGQKHFREKNSCFCKVSTAQTMCK